MLKKLGEILIERGVITAGALDKALRNQLMLGGHLGTCLLELGYMEESVLGQVLAEVNGVPYATPAHFDQIRSLAIRSLSRKVVEECRAVPLQRNGKDLAVAMVNPRDLASRDSLAFASGCKIVPWVAPEVRIFDAMEKFYGVARRQRYVAISRSRSPLEIGLGRNSDTRAAVMDRPATEEGREKRDDQPGWGDDPYVRNQRSWREIANELFPEDAAPAPVKRPDVAIAAPPGPASAEPAATNSTAIATAAPTANGQPALVRAAERLCNADSPEDVARAVLDEVSRLLPRTAVFSVKGDDLRFWAGRGMGDSNGSRATVPFPLSSRGIFGHLAGEDSYCGPLRRDPDCQPFYDWLGLPPPAGILLVPVHLNDRLVALIYGDADERRIDAKPADVERLSRMLGFALTAIIYKNKIRGIGALAQEARA